MRVAAMGVEWNQARRWRAVVAALLALMTASAVGLPVAGNTDTAEPPVTVIVRTVAGATDAVGDTVARFGGSVSRKLRSLDTVVARVPADKVDDLDRSEGVAGVAENRKLRLLNTAWDPSTDAGSTANVNRTINAREAFGRGITGKGVGIALIDSGIVPVQGIASKVGKVFQGPDLSFESQSPQAQLDTFGHGTHLAGIIAGRDSTVAAGKEADPSAGFVGVAPDANLLSLKVATADGATDVTQVMAAIDWVVQHRNDNGMNIRVINLAFGTDATQSYTLDPLAYAAEVAWRKGIVVVVSAGNGGTSAPRLTNPAIDPYVIAVGSSDGMGTVPPSDDTVASFSSRGTPERRPDVLAPGRSLVSLRNPGSNADLQNPSARVGDRFFRGSGTSQSAAVTAGAAALLLQQRPSLTPDGVKKLLMANARQVKDTTAYGAGVLDVSRAIADTTTPLTAQTWPTSTGTGSLEASRGSNHVSMDGVELTGERDIFGNAWDGTSWSGTSWSGTSWSGGAWNGTSWSGTSWSGTSWSGTSWSGTSWSGTSWSGTSWSGTSWSGTSWSGTSWSSNAWNGTSWSGTSWSGTSWSGTSWSGTSWSGTSWSGTSWSGTSWSSTFWGGPPSLLVDV